LHYMGVHKENFTDGKMLVGLSATPRRRGGSGLGKLFHDFYGNYDVIYGMQQGWLVTPEWVKVKTDIDISKVKLKGDFFDDEELAEAIDTQVRNEIIFKSWEDEGRGQAIVYCQSVDHAYNVAELFRQRGVSAQTIEAKSNKNDRINWLDEFRECNLEVLTNFNTLCLDAETEILTSDGWVGIDEMSYDHEVGNFHPETEQLTFTKPKHITRRQRKENERMVSLQTNRVNFRVTEDHRMLVYNSYKKQYEVKLAKDVVGKPYKYPVCANRDEPYQKYEIEQKPKLSEKQIARRITAGAYAIRTRHPEISKKESRKQMTAWTLDQQKRNQYKGISDLSIDECKFLGFFLGDGSYGKKHGGGACVTFSASPVYTEIIEWFDGLLNRLGLNHYRGFQANKSNGGIRWNIPRGTGGGVQTAIGFEPYTPYLNKHDVKWLYGLNKEQFNAFLLGFHLADGTHGNNVPDSIEATYISTTFHELMKTVQSIAVGFGYRCSLSHVNKPGNHTDQKGIYLTKRVGNFYNTGLVKPQFETDWKEERVWCVTVDSTFIVTRRKGRVIITGNSTGIDFPELRTIIFARPIGSDILYEQILGRVLRPSQFAMVDAMPDAASRREAILASEKPYAKVIDLVDTTGAVRLMNPLTLLGISDKVKTPDKVKVFEQVYEPLEKAKKQHGVDISEITDLDAIDTIVTRTKGIDLGAPKAAELAALSDLKWFKVGEDEYELISTKEYKTLVVTKNELERWELSEFDMKSASGMGKVLNTFESLPGAIRVADEYAESFADFPYLKRLYHQSVKPPTQKQINFILRLFGRSVFVTDEKVTIRGWGKRADIVIETMEEAADVITKRLKK